MNHDDIPMWDDPAESSALRQLLRAGRNAVSEYDADRGLARHLAAVQAAGAVPKWALGAAARGASTPLLTWLVVPLVAASAFVGVWFVARESQAPEPMVVPDQVIDPATARALPHAQPAPELLAPQANAAPQAVAMVDDPKLSANDDRSARSGLRANARSLVQRHQRNLESGRVATRALDEVTPTPTSASPSSIAAIAPSEDNRATDNRATTHAAESATQAPTSQERAAPPSAATADEPATKPSVAKADAVHPTPVDDARLEREMQMLAVAQRVLPTDPVRALRLARQGDREFAGSMFSAERKQIGLLALVQLGHLDEARRLGAPFLVAYPNAPWSERLRRALATGRIPAP